MHSGNVRRDGAMHLKSDMVSDLPKVETLSDQVDLA